MWTEPILHVDMDAFFVEVERLADPGLVGRPVAVGGVGPRGVIASASYEARSYGVRSAQATSTARRLCPHLIVVPPSHGGYGEKSVELFSIFRSVTPLVEGLSIDEAFLDVSGLTRHFPSAVEVGKEVRTRVRDEVGLPSSVGVASTKFLAKLASQAAKPDGLYHVPQSSQLEYLHGLPVTSLWGVGPATHASLEGLGVETIGDIAELPEMALTSVLGPALGRRLLDLARGLDPRPVEPDTKAKSISVEQTYDDDLTGRDVVETALLAHAQRLSLRLRRSGTRAKTIGVKVRHADFATFTRSKTLTESIGSSRDLFRAAVDLLGDVDVGLPIRLLGISASSLETEDLPYQIGFDTDDGQTALDDAVGEIRERFGLDAVRPARLAEPPDHAETNQGG